jgi:hypothetical protein
VTTVETLGDNFSQAVRAPCDGSRGDFGRATLEETLGDNFFQAVNAPFDGTRGGLV